MDCITYYNQYEKSVVLWVIEEHVELLQQVVEGIMGKGIHCTGLTIFYMCEGMEGVVVVVVFGMVEVSEGCIVRECCIVGIVGGVGGVWIGVEVVGG